MKRRSWQRTVLGLGALGLLAGLALAGEGWQPGSSAQKRGSVHGYRYGTVDHRHGGPHGRQADFCLERGWQNGYAKGVEKGWKDLDRRRGYDPWRHDAFRDADGGYRNGYGNKAAYRKGYRRGFEEGYRQGYGRHHRMRR